MQVQDVASHRERDLGQQIPTGSHFTPGDTWECLAMFLFLLSQLGVAAGSWGIEARDAAHPPAVPGTAAPDKVLRLSSAVLSSAFREATPKVTT